VNGKENLGKMGLEMPLVGLGPNDFDFSLVCKHLPRFISFLRKRFDHLTCCLCPLQLWNENSQQVHNKCSKSISERLAKIDSRFSNFSYSLK
jgi:hypothetical protein